MASSAADLTSRLLRHERVLLGGPVLLLAALSWTYLLADAGMPPMQPPPLTALISMWWVMMIAMMLPSATPAILLYARVRHSRNEGAAIGQPWMFLVGYLSVWLLFSIGAALAQRELTDASMALQTRLAQAVVLCAAGSYQLSSFKSACISQCRSPGQFISHHWRRGWHGAIRLGVIHGAYCVGCCWLLMALLFVGGVMNIFWVLGLTVLVTAEKLLPSGQWIQKVSGAVLIGWGVFKALGLA
jgi:predicted metal-binding membrane protein